MTFHCRACGLSLAHDPAKKVPCPQCGADVGSPCRRPSDHRCKIHNSRDRLSLAVTDFVPCPENGGETGPEAARNLLEGEIQVASALEKMDLSFDDLRQVAQGEWPLDEASDREIVSSPSSVATDGDESDDPESVQFEQSLLGEWA